MPASYKPLPIWANIAINQAAWLACVLSAAHGLPWLGTLAAVVAVAHHLRHVSDPQAELAMILAAGIIGLAWESLLVQVGWVTYPNGTLLQGFAPHWIVALWLVFATTFNVSLRWFKDRLMLAALFGLFGGPLAFYAGAALGALSLEPLDRSLTVIALGWCLLMPLMMLLSRRLDGLPAEPSSPYY
ncbi:MAG: DUF2878 domain-containing protein [Candidatus Methylumidiphilus sp.]